MIIKSLINLGKFSLVTEPFIILSKLAFEQITADSASQFTISPIPSSLWKNNFRGFNPSLIIAKNLATYLNLTVNDMLRKRSFLKQQKLLNKQMRAKNIRTAFSIAKDITVSKKVILVDDITTSGSTFLESSKILKKAGSAEVWCLALAQD
jgi:ComF family protein